jgi:hypothetical protein
MIYAVETVPGSQPSAVRLDRGTQHPSCEHPDAESDVRLESSRTIATAASREMDNNAATDSHSTTRDAANLGNEGGLTAELEEADTWMSKVPQKSYGE